MNAVEIPKALVDCARSASHVVALTGAGISAESGVPTFREAQTGLWSRYRPEELATPQAFIAQPSLVWDWYMMRRGMLADVARNAGHLALSKWEAGVEKFTLITQNVDGLHRVAGHRDPLALHGDIQLTKCFDCERPAVDYDQEASPPRCDHCGGYLRPDVVWFGESLPMGILRAATEAVASCDLLLSIGTSSLVQPAASLPFEALSRGVPVVEVNPQQTPLSPHATWTLNAPAGEILPRLVALTLEDKL